MTRLFAQQTDFTLYVGDAREVLASLPAGSVDCCVTSPPYWGLRDYGTAEWVGGDQGCDHAPEARGGRFASPVSEKQRSNAGSGTMSSRDCRCGATRVDSQLGLESTPEEYVEALVGVFREVRRVLADTGTLWCNLGSSYNGAGYSNNANTGGATREQGVKQRHSYVQRGSDPSQSHHEPHVRPYDSDGRESLGSQALDFVCRGLCDEHLADFLSHHERIADTSQLLSRDEQRPSPTGRGNGRSDSEQASLGASLLGAQASTTIESWLRLRGSCSRCDARASFLSAVPTSTFGAQGSAHMSWLNYTSRLKPKDLVPIPWMVALALQEDGWYLRSDIIWSKPNSMPESVRDRPTKSHEYVFLLSKQPRYFFDQEAVREPHSPDGRKKTVHDHLTDGSHANYDNIGNGHERWPNGGRNIRSVWDIATQPYAEAHFATYPEELVRRCLLAGCPEGGTVLDPFMGSGTTAVVARKLCRNAVGVELNESYAALAVKRLGHVHYQSDIFSLA